MKPMLWPTLVLALATLPLAAQPERGRGPERIARALDLSETQLSALRAIREKHLPELHLKREATRRAQVELRHALREPATPEPQLRALHDRAAAARFDLMLARRSARLEVRSVFTPEQRERAAELRGMARERQRERLRQAG